jgi:V/A-type H+/Na+-transporting ATPase subunit I
MITKLKKLLIYGIADDLGHFLKKSQEKGFLEFINQSSQKFLDVNDDFNKINTSLKILKRYPSIKQEQKQMSTFPILAIAQNIIQLNKSLEKHIEKKRFLRVEISRISPFGNFSKKDIEYIQDKGKLLLQYYCISTSKAKNIKIPKELIYVTTEYDLNYYIAFNKQKKAFKNFIEMEIEEPLSEVQENLSTTLFQIKKIEQDLRELTKYFDLLKIALLNNLNDHNLKISNQYAASKLEGSLFTLTAWVPVNKLKEIDELSNNLSVSYEMVIPDKKEKVPTYLENYKTSKVGEDLVKIYDIPSNEDKDPSAWVIWAFTIFFALIISDAGYGLLYLLVFLFMKWKFKKATGSLKRFIKLTKMLAISCLIWGVMSGSFFGMGVNANNPLDKVTFLNYVAKVKANYHLKVKDDVYKDLVGKYPEISSATSGKEMILASKKTVKNETKFEILDTFKDNILMELSLFIGAIHIMLSFLHNIRRSPAGIGWVIAIIGGYLFLPSFVNATTFMNFIFFIPKSFAFFVGKYMLFSGIFLSVLFAIIKNGISGISELVNLVQVFADILSYLRLYALGLAGMIMASTFNSMGASMPIFFGIFVIIIGHIINITLGIMGGIIHGLRLNFIEWYNHCFDGDGKLFNPLKLFK